MSAVKGELYFNRQIEIDGLRGLSILLVIVGHISQRFYRFSFDREAVGPVARYFFDTAGASASGVYLLFSISGFLVARSLSKIQRPNKSNIGRFYARRVLRIAPPYLLVLCLTWLSLTLSGWVPQRTNQFQTQPASLTESLLASVFFLHQIVYGTLPRLFPPGWTLEVEVHFYVLSPLLCIGFTRFVRWGGLGAASAWTLSASGVVALVSLHSGLERLLHTLPVYLPLFLLGIVAHTVWQGGWRPSLWLMPTLGLPAYIVFAALQPLIGGIGIEIVVRMVLIAVMFGALASGRGALYWLCTRPVFAQVGIVSYSAYLVHLQVVHTIFLTAELCFGRLIGIEMFAVVIFSILMICLVTVLFYLSIEKPLREYGADLRGVVPSPIRDAFHRRML